jgi:hypothetical protein
MFPTHRKVLPRGTDNRPDPAPDPDPEPQDLAVRQVGHDAETTEVDCG